MRLVYLTGGMMAGLLLAAGTSGVSSFLWLAILVVSVILLWLGNRAPRPLALLLFGMALAGYRWMVVPQSADIQRYLDQGGTQIEGVVTGEPELRDTSIQFRLDPETVFTQSQTVPTNGAILVKAPRTALVQYGDRVRVTGLLVTAAQIDTFNYADYLARTGLYGLMQNAFVEVIDSQPPAPILAALLNFKRGTQQRIAQSLPEPAAGLLTGILTGGEQNISPELAEAFARTGAAHIIAISGFNMALLSGLVMRLFPPILGIRKAAMLGIGLLVVYTLFVGAGAGVVRAALMSSLLILAPLFKRGTQQRIAQVLPEPAAGLLTGILTGGEQNISPELAEAFARTGAAHIIAISGFNMALLSGLVMRLFPPILGIRKAAMLGIGLLVVYTLFVGAGAGVVRAALMSSLLILAPLFKRESFVPASLCGAAFLMLLLNPFVLWDISFQLSFGAVLGLSLFGMPFAQAWGGMLKRVFPAGLARIINGFTGEAIPVSLAAQVFTLPLIVLYFQRFSLVALIVNVLVLPLQPLILYLGLSGALLAWIIPPLAQAILWLVFVLLMMTIGVVRTGSRLPFADVPLYIHPYILALMIGLIGGGAFVQAVRPEVMKRLTTFARSRPAWMTVIIGGVCVAVLLWAIGFSRADGQLHVWFLAQGHSPAVLIQTPNGAKILVDGGRYPSRLLTALGDRLPFYDRQLDALIITQPDPFDMGALPAVLERYTVGAAITNGQPNQDDAFLTLMDALAQTPLIEARAGTQMTTDDGVTIDILHPSERPNLGDSLDENGLILRVRYGTISFLLTGDADIGTLMQVGETADLTSTVLSLPQHGTQRSLTAEFLALVQPSAAVLQSDPANRRGDPDEDVLRLVEERGIPLLRTDLKGTIHFYTDGDRLWTVEE